MSGCGDSCDCGGNCACKSEASEMDNFSMKLNKIAVARQNVETLSVLSQTVDRNTELGKDVSAALHSNVKALKNIDSL